MVCCMRSIKIIIGLIVLVFIALLPLSVSQFIGRQFGKFLYRGQRSRVFQVSKTNIDLCFSNRDEQFRESLLENSLVHTCMGYAEMGMSWLWPTRFSLAKIVSVKGEDVFQQAIAEGKGVIIVAPHIGNWEILNLYTSKNYSITVLYKPPKIKFFDWLIHRMRKRLGSDMAPANGKGVKKLMQKLRASGVVGILPDQEPDEGSGMFSPFFGRPAYTMTLLSQLAIKTGCKVVTGAAIRQPQGDGYIIEFTAVDEQINNKDLNQSVAALNNAVEDLALKYPEQYQWEYKRFRKHPDSEPRLYD